MLRSLIKPTSLFRNVVKQRAFLATSSRQIRGAQASLIEADDESAQTASSKLALAYLCKKNSVS